MTSIDSARPSLRRHLAAWSLGLAGAVAAVACDSATNVVPVDDASTESAGEGGASDAGVTSDTGPSGEGAVDAPAAIEGGDVAAPFDVAAVPGLSLWLDAAKGVLQFTGVVASWADQSSHQNHAAQSIVYNRPTFTPSAINGLPGVHFDKDAQWGTFLTIADAPSLHWGTGDYYLAVVARFDNDTGGAGANNRFGTFYFKQGTWDGGVPEGLFFQANAPGKTATSGFAAELRDDDGYRVASVGAGYNDNQGHLFAVRRSGTSLELRHNGAADGQKTLPVADVSAPAIAVSIGATVARVDSNRLNGDIAEIIAVQGTLSNEALTGIESYLKAKYALP